MKRTGKTSGRRSVMVADFLPEIFPGYGDQTCFTADDYFK